MGFFGNMRGFIMPNAQIIRAAHEGGFAVTMPEFVGAVSEITEIIAKVGNLKIIDYSENPSATWETDENGVETSMNAGIMTVQSVLSAQNGAETEIYEAPVAGILLE